MSCRLWSVLHRSFDFLPHPRHARRKACGCALHPPRGRLPLRAVRRPQPSSGLFKSAGDGGDVRDQRCRGAGLSRTPRTHHRAGISRSARCLSTAAPARSPARSALAPEEMGQKPSSRALRSVVICYEPRFRFPATRRNTRRGGRCDACGAPCLDRWELRACGALDVAARVGDREGGAGNDSPSQVIFVADFQARRAISPLMNRASGER